MATVSCHSNQHSYPVGTTTQLFVPTAYRRYSGGFREGSRGCSNSALSPNYLIFIGGGGGEKKKVNWQIEPPLANLNPLSKNSGPASALNVKFGKNPVWFMVSEEMSFENVDGQTTDARLYYKPSLRVR